MPRNFNLIFPHYLSNWKKVFNYINDLLKDYDINVKTITDVINVLRELRCLMYGSQNHLYQDDIFLGLGVFLTNLKVNELNTIINKSIRNILYYCKLIEQLEMNLENEFSIKNDVTKVSLLSAKSVLACSILCLMPHQKIENINSTEDERLSVNFQQLYNGIIQGSNEHHQTLLTSVFRYYLVDPHQSLDHDTHSYITVTVANCDPSPLTTREPLHLWPIVIVAKSPVTDTPLPNSLNLWPMFFQRIAPSNLFSSGNLFSELPIYSSLPVLIPLLPLLTLSVSENIGAINVKWEKFSGSLQKIHFISPWDRDSQYLKESIVENIAHCLLAIKTSQKDCQQCDVNFANNFTQSIIEDVILKLNSKSTVSSTYSDSAQHARASLTSNVLRSSRENSLSGGNPVARSSRHSYSNSSSSRSGSIQLSSLSSRRSSSNTSSSQNKETEYGTVSTADKLDYSVHNFQPVIVEESGNHVDDDDLPLKPKKSLEEPDLSLSTLDRFMSASISDSTKMCLAKDNAKNAMQSSVPEFGIRRRNSSPLLRSLYTDDDDNDHDSSQLHFEQKQLSNRCCEEDANNDHLIRLNNRGRRQSLPCHLQWLYQIPLTDTVKINLSLSRSSYNDSGSSQTPATTTAGGDFLDGRIMIDSRQCLSRLLKFVDKLMNGISLTGDRNEEQQNLCAEILTKRRLFETVYYGDGRDSQVTPDESLSVSCDDHSLLSRDLATFDRVLNSSTFFDNEALHFFSKFSTMSSPNSVWTPREEIPGLGDSDTVIAQVSHHVTCAAHDKRPQRSDAGTIVEYVNQLTTSIISDAIDHNYTTTNNRSANGKNGSSSSSSSSPTCDQCIYNYADRISVHIITTSLLQLTNKDGKTPFDASHLSPIYVRPFPLEYDRQLSVLVQLLAGAISQLQTGRSHVMVFDQVTVEMEEIFLLLATEKRKCNPEKVLKAIMAIMKESGTISISSLISYLMHNY